MQYVCEYKDLNTRSSKLRWSVKLRLFSLFQYSWITQRRTLERAWWLSVCNISYPSRDIWNALVFFLLLIPSTNTVSSSFNFFL